VHKPVAGTSRNLSNEVATQNMKKKAIRSMRALGGFLFSIGGFVKMYAFSRKQPFYKIRSIKGPKNIELYSVKSG
jgi:hypothetical protein